MAELDPHALEGTRDRLRRVLHDRPRRVDRQRRAAVDRQVAATSRSENLQWVITAYAITFGGFLLLGGRAADLLGRRRVFLHRRRGLHDRVVPLRPRVVGRRADRRARACRASAPRSSRRPRSRSSRRRFEEGAERNKALGIWGAIGGSGAAVGVLAGGVLTKYLGWEWIFFVNVPVGVARVPARAALRPREPLRARAARPTSQAPSRSPPGSRCSSTPSRRRPNHGWGSGWTISRLVALARAARRLPRDRVARRRTR